MRLLLFFVLVGVFSSVVSGYTVTEFYPDTLLDGDMDEYIVLEGNGSLRGISLSDGEGEFSFPGDAHSSGRLVIAREGQAFLSVWGEMPDYEMIDTLPAIPEVKVTGSFQLSNKADAIELMNGGTFVQSVSWPEEVSCRKGQIHFCGTDGIWDPYVLMEGAERFEPYTAEDVSGIIAVSPDSARSLLEDIILDARDEILICVYEFTDPGIADLLLESHAAGVDVTVLVEGGPVGGISPEEEEIVSRLSNDGIGVYAMGGQGRYAPFRFIHAKFLIADEKDLFLTTENFKGHSFPVPGYSGNRGWSVMITSPELASYFSRVFHADISAPGVIPIHGKNGTTEHGPSGSYSPLFSSLSFSGACVTAVLSPDTSSLVTRLIEKAERRLLVQQAYISHYPDGKENPYLKAVVDAARRGVCVRVILDAYPYNIEDDADNDEMVDYLNKLALKESLPLEAKLIDLESTGLIKVHTKGVIADDSVLISSINWNENSPTFNREAGLIITSPEVASYFTEVFEKDWEGSGPRVVDPGSDSVTYIDPLKGVILAGVLILLFGVYLLKKR